MRVVFALTFVAALAACVSQGDTVSDSRQTGGDDLCTKFCNRTAAADCVFDVDCPKTCTFTQSSESPCAALWTKYYQCAVDAPAVVCAASRSPEFGGCQPLVTQVGACEKAADDDAACKSTDVNACSDCCAKAHGDAGTAFYGYGFSCVCEADRCGGPSGPCAGFCASSPPDSSKYTDACKSCYSKQGPAGCYDQALAQCQKDAACQPYITCVQKQCG